MSQDVNFLEGVTVRVQNSLILFKRSSRKVINTELLDKSMVDVWGSHNVVFVRLFFQLVSDVN